MGKMDTVDNKDKQQRRNFVKKPTLPAACASLLVFNTYGPPLRRPFALPSSQVPLYLYLLPCLLCRMTGLLWSYDWLVSVLVTTFTTFHYFYKSHYFCLTVTKYVGKKIKENGSFWLIFWRFSALLQGRHGTRSRRRLVHIACAVRKQRADVTA